jgi:hypothetical protein
MNAEIETLKKYLIEENNTEFERSLHQVLKDQNPEKIGELLVLFDDGYDLYELLFSIIHGIENFKDEVYINQLLNNLIELHKNAPEWTKLILTRIKNNEETIQVLKSEYKKYPNEISIIVNSYIN